MFVQRCAARSLVALDDTRDLAEERTQRLELSRRQRGGLLTLASSAFAIRATLPTLIST